MKTAIVIAAAIVATSSSLASANSIDRRQANQIERIEDGRNNGTITWREGIKLRREQAVIARTEAQFKADGYLSRDEKRALTQLQDKASHDIAHETTDGWRRAWWLPRFGR
jgi:hypothetical protein